MRKGDSKASETSKPAAPALPVAVHGWALGLFAVVTLVLILLFCAYADVNVWGHFQESRELRNTHYSETVYIESIFRTRANTWSNLAFVLVGFYGLAAAFRDRRFATGWFSSATRSTPPTLTLLFGVACCYLGLGSGVFHASITRWGQQLDVASMYPPMLALIAMLLHRNLLTRLHWLERSGPVVAGLLAVVVAGAAVLFYVYKWSMSSGTVLPLHVLALALCYGVDRLLWRPNGKLRWLTASFLALFVGVVCRQMDVAGNFSGPDAWYQGHAIWHVLCAVSLGCGWWYVRSGEVHPHHR